MNMININDRNIFIIPNYYNTMVLPAPFSKKLKKPFLPAFLTTSTRKHVYIFLRFKCLIFFFRSFGIFTKATINEEQIIFDVIALCGTRVTSQNIQFRSFPDKKDRYNFRKSTLNSVEVHSNKKRSCQMLPASPYTIDYLFN